MYKNNFDKYLDIDLPLSKNPIIINVMICYITLKCKTNLLFQFQIKLR